MKRPNNLTGRFALEAGLFLLLVMMTSYYFFPFLKNISAFVFIINLIMGLLSAWFCYQAERRFFLPLVFLILIINLLFYSLQRGAFVNPLSSNFIDAWITSWQIFLKQSAFIFKSLLRNSPSSYPELALLTALSWGAGLFILSLSFLKGRYILITWAPLLVLMAALLKQKNTGYESILYFCACLFLLRILRGQSAREEQWTKQKKDYSDQLWPVSAGMGFALLLPMLLVCFFLSGLTPQKIHDFFTYPASAQKKSALNDELRLLNQEFIPEEKILPDQKRKPDFANREEPRFLIYPPEKLTSGRFLRWKQQVFNRYQGFFWQADSVSQTIIPASPKKVFQGRILFTVDYRGSGKAPLIFPQTLRALGKNYLRLENEAGHFVSASVQNSIYLLAVEEKKKMKYKGKLSEQTRKLYLQLPENISERLKNLHKEMVSQAQGLYQEAQAIENYLRSLEYELLEIDPRQTGELVDHFIFNDRKGYCRHFATSMCVFARLSQIPARFVSGYLMRDYDEAQRAYVLKRKDYHAWAELYFEDWGWLVFDATPTVLEAQRDFEKEGEEKKEIILPELDVFLLPLLVSIFCLVILIKLMRLSWAILIKPQEALLFAYQKLKRKIRPYVQGEFEDLTLDDCQKALRYVESQLLGIISLTAEQKLIQLYEVLVFSAEIPGKKNMLEILLKVSVRSFFLSLILFFFIKKKS